MWHWSKHWTRYSMISRSLKERFDRNFLKYSTLLLMLSCHEISPESIICSEVHWIRWPAPWRRPLELWIESASNICAIHQPFRLSRRGYIDTMSETSSLRHLHLTSSACIVCSRCNSIWFPEPWKYMLTNGQARDKITAQTCVLSFDRSIEVLKSAGRCFELLVWRERPLKMKRSNRRNISSSGVADIVTSSYLVPALRRTGCIWAKKYRSGPWQREDGTVGEWG